jgi:signal transduction histidine kinase
LDRKLFVSHEKLLSEQKRRQDQSQLLSMLMHEIKTPLSIIDMAVHTRTHDDRTTNYVQNAVTSIKDIIDRCIQTDRLAESELLLCKSQVNFSNLVLHGMNLLRHESDRLILRVVPNLEVQSDIQCLQIIVNNLVENAFRHGDDSSPVSVALHVQFDDQRGHGVALIVRNRPGVSGWPEPEQLFKRYYRSAGAKKKSGSGLGLYLSHRLAEKLGGTLRYLPDTEHIIFELWLPV